MSGPKPSYGEMREKLSPDDTEGKPSLLTIVECDLRNLAPKGQGEDWKITLVFAEIPEKEYVVNSTSYKTLCTKLGKDHETWKGQQVVMAPTTTEYGGKSYEKIHVASIERWDKVAASVAKAKSAKK